MDLDALMFRRFFDPLGIRPADLIWRDNAYRDETINGIKRREFGSGIRADVDAMARIGYLYLRRGAWEGRRIVPSGFVARASRPEPSLAGLPGTGSGNRPGATSHYGLLWWNNGDRSLLDVPPDAFWSWGLADSLIIVIRASISSSTLSRGTDTIMASVTDSDVEAGSASLTLIA